MYLSQKYAPSCIFSLACDKFLKNFAEFYHKMSQKQLISVCIVINLEDFLQNFITKYLESSILSLTCDKLLLLKLKKVA